MISRSDSFDTALAIQLRAQVWNDELTKVIHSLSTTGGAFAATQEDDLTVATLRMVMDCVSDLSRLKKGEERHALQLLYDHGRAVLLAATTTEASAGVRASHALSQQSRGSVDMRAAVGRRPVWPNGLTDPYGFSPREREVLDLLLRSQRVSVIARKINLSPHTVRNHLKSIFRKVGVHSQADLLQRFSHQSVSL